MTTMHANGTGHLLIIEDNDDDYEMLETCFDELDIDVSKTRCSDGKEALDLLSEAKELRLSKAPLRPSIILLDLNLPRLDGKSLLKKIKADAALSLIPVVIFSSSKDHKEIASCYQIGANGYLQKQSGVANMIQALKSFYDFWFNHCLIPKN